MVACMTIDGLSAAISVTFSLKETLAARKLIRICVAIQFLALVVVGIMIGRLKARTECCSQVFWWGAIDSCTGPKPSFWVHFSLRFSAWLHTSWLSLYHMHFYDKAEKATKATDGTKNGTTPSNGTLSRAFDYLSRGFFPDTAEDTNISSSRYNEHYTTTFTKYIDWAAIAVSSIIATERVLHVYDLHAGSWGDWGQSAATMVAIGLICRCSYFIYEIFKHNGRKKKSSSSDSQVGVKIDGARIKGKEFWQDGGGSEIEMPAAGKTEDQEDGRSTAVENPPDGSVTHLRRYHVSEPHLGHGDFPI